MIMKEEKVSPKWIDAMLQPYSGPPQETMKAILLTVRKQNYAWSFTLAGAELRSVVALPV